MSRRKHKPENLFDVMERGTLDERAEQCREILRLDVFCGDSQAFEAWLDKRQDEDGRSVREWLNGGEDGVKRAERMVLQLIGLGGCA